MERREDNNNNHNHHNNNDYTGSRTWYVDPTSELDGQFLLSDCLTVSEEPCVFPFTFGGVVHTKCTMDQSVNGLAWCATQVNETTGETMNGRWSDCRSENCPIECTCPEEELSLVCGQDGITYSSECAAHCEKVALDYPGECLPKGGQCRFSQDCRNFSSCSGLQDASCICLHGTCEVQVGLLQLLFLILIFRTKSCNSH